MSELFLFAGGVVEPDVSVDRTRVDYGALMLGATLKETFHIVNREEMPHSFIFDKNSLGIAQVRLSRHHALPVATGVELDKFKSAPPSRPFSLTMEVI